MNPLPAILTHFAGPAGSRTAEGDRRARLLTGFGLLGAVFGGCYALFYLLIAHYWGAGVIIVCSSAFATIPWLVRRQVPLTWLGHAFAIILVAGFVGLCCVEGGLHGHAIAWLATIPLYALLLIGLNAATLWGSVCVLAAAAVAACELTGISLPNLCPEPWQDVVSTAGYLGLTLFMLLLGVIFERGRSVAAGRMQTALDQLSSANTRLQQLNQEKNEFLSIAAHDLKNPLTVVMGMSDLLASGRHAGEKVVATSRKISEQAIRMRDLISNLLDLNAIEEGRMNLQRTRIDLAQLCAASVEGFQEMAGRKQITLNLRSPAEPSSALGDGQAVQQVLDNLISNAIKYSPSGKHVHVVLDHRDEHVVVEVRDHGPGLSEADQAKLFQRFVRLSSKPTAGESSNGLGLSIVKRLVEGMGGEIRCRSQVGVGTSFIFSLPAACPPRPDSAAALAAVPEKRMARVTPGRPPVDLRDVTSCPTVGA